MGNGEACELLNELTPTQEHFLKKYILENRLAHELHYLSQSDCCQNFGPPFKTTNEDAERLKMPLLDFFFHRYVETFPFIANNSPEDQLAFWQGTVQPFLESFNSKNMSDSNERMENKTKRKQFSTKIASGLLLYFNSMLVTDKDMEYIESTHLKATETSSLDKLSKGKSPLDGILELGSNNDITNFSDMKFTNDLHLNIVAVRSYLNETLPAPTSTPDQAKSSNLWQYLKSFANLGIPTGEKRHHFEFIIQVVSRKLGSEGAYEYESFFIAKAYHDFKALEKHLKKAYPGLMATEVTGLPKKFKSDDGVKKKIQDKVLNGTLRSDSPSPQGTDRSSSGLNTVLSNNSSVSIGVGTLAREKLRLALRGYLNAIIKHPEVVHSEIFKKFLFQDDSKFTKLSPEEHNDFTDRMQHETIILETQYEFQKQTARAILELTKRIDDLKNKLVMSPDALSQIFNEIGTVASVKDVSPLLRTFFDWCKLQVASTLYQAFLSADNSSEWLLKCKKFHAFFPYNIVYGILKFTNPMKIMSKIIDLLLVNFPSFSMPSWFSSNDSKLEAASNESSRNLLSFMFIMLLNEDLSDFEKEYEDLRENRLGSNASYTIFVERIDNYVHMPDGDTIDSIKERSRVSEEDLLLTILSCDEISPVLELHDYATLDEIKKSFASYNDLKNEHSLKNSQLYFNLKQYWLLQLRRRDKELIKQLWKEPELTKLIKTFLTIFYQPLMKVFAKSNIHLVFRDFQKFMDDLLDEFTELSNGEIYFLTPMQIYERAKAVLDRHEDMLWNFIHNVYVNDDDKLFYKLIKWIEMFLATLRFKYTDRAKVTLDLVSLAPPTLDSSILKHQLNGRIYCILQKRHLLKQYLRKKAEVDEKKTNQEKILDQWTKINDSVFNDFSGHDLGLNHDDLTDFDVVHLDILTETESCLDIELRQNLDKLDLLMENYGTSELDKFDLKAQDLLSSLLQQLNLSPTSGSNPGPLASR